MPTGQEIGASADDASEGPWAADDGDGHYYGIFDANGAPIAYLVEAAPAARYSLLPLDEEYEQQRARGHALDVMPREYRHASAHRANAMVLASAPELLQSLKAMERLVREWFDPDEIDPRVLHETRQQMVRAQRLLGKLEPER